jgi:hypothetical protein
VVTAVTAMTLMTVLYGLRASVNRLATFYT